MRKPVEQNINEFDIRQSVWDEIQKKKQFRKGDFKWFEGHKTTKNTYVDSLEKAGFISKLRIDPKDKASIYEVLVTNKIAPSVNKAGLAVFEGKLNQRMWQVMKIQKVFSAIELAEFTNAKLTTVQAYLKHLTRSKYLKRFKKNNRTLYMFIEAKNTGYYAPMIKKSKDLYDPNINKIIKTETITYVLD